MPLSPTLVLSTLLAVLPPGPRGSHALDPKGAETRSSAVDVLQVRHDTFLGNPESAVIPPLSSSLVPDGVKKLEGKVYRSPWQGYSIRVPQVAGDTRVSIRQCIVSRRPDGTPITSHVLFEPSTGWDRHALVVTRLREDRPKDPASVLDRFCPRSAEEYAAYATSGVSYRLLEGPWGLVLQRGIRNRVRTAAFPYGVSVDTRPERPSFSLSRYVVMGDFFCEFSILVGAAQDEKPGALEARAEAEMDMFMSCLVTKPLAETATATAK